MILIAGKTTAINCLIGLQRPSEGVATIYGLDIAKDVQSLHEIMGICPQFDMLFNDMTAMEHLVLINRLKRKSRRHTKDELMERLFRVRLEKVSK
jgi:ABC-type multidrug transport system ATPase subunit